MKELTAYDRFLERQRIAEERMNQKTTGVHEQRFHSSNPPLYSGGYVEGVLAERKRIVDLFMIQHEAAKGAHNYWQVAANLVQADVASDT